jgi:hypothetical protein
MKTELGWMTCITADPPHLLESHSVAAPLRLAVPMISVVSKISAVLMTRDGPRINVVLRISDVQMRTTTHQRQRTILQPMAFRPHSCHPCNKALHQSTHLFIHLFMNCHRPLKHPRSIQVKSSARESNSTTLHPHLLLLASQNVLHERWMLTKITMMTEKMRRREALYLDLDLHPEMPRLPLQPALMVMQMVCQTVNPKLRHLLDFDSSFVLISWLQSVNHDSLVELSGMKY